MLGALVFTLLPLLAAWCHARCPEGGWREATVTAALLWGVGVLLASEAVGAITALDFYPVLGLWLLAHAVVAVQLRRARLAVAIPPRPGLTPSEWAIAAGLALLFALPLVRAFAAPPNTPDVLSYHLPRQLLWLQQHSLAHFATMNDRALMMPPFAEIVQAHALLLSGGDRWANFPQWLALALGAIVVSLLARDLGGGRRAQLLAAFVFATLPMVYHEASSAKNDLLVASWLGVFAWQAQRKARLNWPALGAAGGLALATKTTALIFVPIFALAAVGAARRNPRGALLAAALAGLLVAPHAWRNTVHFHTPLGIHRAEDGGAAGSESFSPGTIAVNVLRNATLHVATPSAALNARLHAAVAWIAARIGQDVNDPRTTFWITRYDVVWGPGLELVAGAPAQFLLGLLALATVLSRCDPRRDPAGALALTALGAALLCCAVLKWQPWGARLHLPIFTLLAAVIACAAERRGHTVAAVVAAICFAAWLPAAETRQRPLWEEPTVFSQSRWDNYFLFQPLNAGLQLNVLNVLTAARATRPEIRTTLGVPYPLMRRFLDETGGNARFWGTLDSAGQAPDAVVVLEPLDKPLPLYQAAPNTSRRYRAVGTTDPFGVYLPEPLARKLTPRLGVPAFVGWTATTHLGAIHFTRLGDRTVPLRQMQAAECSFTLVRTAPRMRVRLEVRNLSDAPCRIQVRLDAQRLATLLFEPDAAAQIVEVPFTMPAASGTLVLRATSGEPPPLFFSAIQILD